MKIPLKTRLRFLVLRMIYAPRELWITLELFLQTKKSTSRLGMMMLHVRQELGWRLLHQTQQGATTTLGCANPGNAWLPGVSGTQRDVSNTPA